MEDIEKELEAKSIEREVEIKEVIKVVSDPVAALEPDNPPLGGNPPRAEPVAPKKTKKVRSEKQIAAFEKARLKRAEGIANRKKLKEEQKEEKKQQKKVKISEDVGSINRQGARSGQEQSIPKPVVNSSNPTPTREQVIQNHYYYYGVPPPHAQQPHEYTKSKKKKKKSKRPPTPSSSDSESSEEEYYKDEPPQQEHQHQPPPKPSYKFSYT